MPICVCLLLETVYQKSWDNQSQDVEAKCSKYDDIYASQ